MEGGGSAAPFALKREEAMEREKKDRKKIVIVLLLLLVVILLAAVIWLINQEPETAVLVDSGRELTSNDTGQIRVSVNTSVNIKDGTMQDLFFSNYNQDRLLQCKIKVDDKYVYESQLIDSGKTIQADVIDDTGIPVGQTPAVVEVYSYNFDQEIMGQTNVNISLIKS